MSHYEKVEGPFEIPESWEWNKISELCKNALEIIKEVK